MLTATGGSLSLRRPSKYTLANLGIWGLTYAIVSGRMLSMTYPHPGDMALRRFCVMVLAVVGCQLMRPTLAQLSQRQAGQRIAGAIGLSTLGSLGYALFNYVAFYVVNPRFEWERPALTLISVAEQASVFFWSFLAWTVLFFAIRYEEEARDNSLRLVSAQALAMDAQNRMLRYQINPHFLFNTLNALSALILSKETARAERVVVSLSNYLRYTLETDVPERATVSDEVAAIRQYLSIEQARFEERLVFREQIPEELQGALAPSMILQPLIENAVKYGVARSSGPVTVELLVEAAAGRLQLTVVDDGTDSAGDDPPKLGLGLENIRRRLAAMYGKAASLRCWRRRPHGFAAAIELPLEFA